MTAPFDYPAQPHIRRHGPIGYADYASFRPWLRDEFVFRCVFCLRRESWGQAFGEFAIVPRYLLRDWLTNDFPALSFDAAYAGDGFFELLRNRRHFIRRVRRQPGTVQVRIAQCLVDP